MLPIIKLRKIWFTVSGTLVIASIVAMLGWGVKLGIDFTGGSLLELQFAQERPINQDIQEALSQTVEGDITIQPVEERNVIIRFSETDEEAHQTILAALETKLAEYPFEQLRFDAVGPSIGNELKRKTLWAVIVVVFAIILFIAYAFRKVSKPVASWQYGVIAVIALIHDILITLGIFALLGYLYNVEVNTPFVAALLTILGYSVNDTIVVFDRTRENLMKHIGDDFETVVQDSVNQTLTRSIYSSVTTLAVLFAILLFGGSTIRDFVLALIVGISAGTYSSIFLASPLLVVLQKFKRT